MAYRLLQRNNAKYTLFLLAAAVISHLPFLMSGGFFSDDAIYTYAGFAITKGVIPYAGITLPQPPLGYLFLSVEVAIAQSSLPWIRTLNFAVFLIGLLFVFRVLVKISTEPHAAFLGSLIYALFPPILAYPFSATLEFTYLVTLIFAGLDFALSNTRLSLFLSGVCFGLAAITWYPGLFGLIALLGFVFANNFLETRSPRNSLAGITTTALGALAVVISMLGVVTLYWGVLPQFVTQSLSLQTGLRAGFSQGEKILILTSYWEVFSPLLILGATGMILASLRSKRTKRMEELLLAIWFMAVFALLALIPKVMFPHYFWFLTPVLGYFSAITILETISAFKSRPSYAQLLILLPILIAASAFAYSGLNSYPPNAFVNNVYNASEGYVGHYVANITTPAQLIWTSEAGIAFYANRLIVPPNSSTWKLQGFFDDVFNTSFTDTAMFQHQGSGLVSPIQFEQSWGSSVEVLIFIRGNGPVPYPDTLLWEGWSGTLGVSGWVMSHYSKVALLNFPGDSYLYEVWKRN